MIIRKYSDRATFQEHTVAERKLDPVLQSQIESVGLVELTERLGIPIKRAGRIVKAQSPEIEYETGI